MDNNDLKIFFSTIQRLKGMDFSSYQQKFLLRRLNYRINLTNSESILGYLNLIKRDKTEFDQFLDSLAINVSEFFRDVEVFDYFRENCLKELINRKILSHNKNIRIWSAGCAQGQEVYSLAILLNEELKGRGDFFVRIWGTDMDKGILQQAEKAEFTSNNLKNVDKAMRTKYFNLLSNDLLCLNNEIRQMVRFRECNLINDLPLRYLDVIFCRNVMIYISRQEHEKLLLKFYHALTENGYLVIGKVEIICAALRHKFIPVNLHQKVFQKKKEVEYGKGIGC